MALQGQPYCLVVQVGHGNLQLVLLHKGGGVVGLDHALKIAGKGIVGHLYLHAVGGELQGQGVVVGLVGAHGDAEAGVIPAVALHHGELHQIPYPLVVQILISAVAGVDLGLDVLGVDVAGPGQDENGLLLGLTGPVLVLGEVENSLLDGGNDFLGGVVGLNLPHDVGKAVHLGVLHHISVGIAARLGEPLGGVDPVVLFQCVQHGVRLGGGEGESHAPYLLNS